MLMAISPIQGESTYIKYVSRIYKQIYSLHTKEHTRKLHKRILCYETSMESITFNYVCSSAIPSLMDELRV